MITVREFKSANGIVEENQAGVIRNRSRGTEEGTVPTGGLFSHARCHWSESTETTVPTEMYPLDSIEVGVRRGSDRGARV